LSIHFLLFKNWWWFEVWTCHHKGQNHFAMSHLLFMPGSFAMQGLLVSISSLP
jgi:hypothetical protein